MPEELRPKPGGLSLEEYSVYNEFKKDRRYMTPDKSDQRTSVEKIIEIIQ